MKVIAYTYEADYHCIKCTVKEFDYLRTPKRDYISFKSMCDENRIHVNQKDNEGNEIHPLFSIDEWQEFDESFIAENPIQYLVCGDCHEVIEEYVNEEFGYSDQYL